jgi:O-antigen/teichoic acid export membrane protein
VILTRWRSLHQIALLWGSSIIAAGLAFATQLVLARHLDPATYGIFGSSLALITMLSQFSGFGLQGFWLKAFGQEGWTAQRWVRGSLHFVVISTLLTLLVFSAWAQFGPNDDTTRLTLLLMAPSIAGLAAIELTISKLQLEERYLFISLWQISPQAARLILISLGFVFASGGQRLTWVAIIYTVVAVGLVAVTVKQILAMGAPGFDLRGHGTRGDPQVPATSLIPGDSAPSVKNVAQEAWPFGVDVILYLAYLQISNVLLKYLDGNEAAGLYYAAFNIMNAIYLLPIVLYTKFLLSKQHRWARNDKPRLLSSLKLGSAAMLVIGVVAMLFIWLVAPYLVPLLFGHKYANASGLLDILAVCVPLRFLSTSVGSVLSTGDHMRHRVKLKAICALVCIVLNVALIPRYGTTGAAVVTVITELTLLLLFSVSVMRRYDQLFTDKTPLAAEAHS